MTPTRAVIVERVVLVAGGLCMIAALAAVDPRLGLFLAGILLVLSAIDIPWRRS